MDQNLITLNGFESLKHGRKYHHELGTPGAVGLLLSFSQILNSNTGPILVCEDDCVPSPTLPNVIDEFLIHSSEFDMIVFGPLMYQRTKNSIPSHFKNFDVLNQYYWGNHALLFSSQGRQKAIKYLKPPVDVQLDALFSRMAMYADFRILIQAEGEPLATQAKHASTVQSSLLCPLCDTTPKQVPYILGICILFTMSFVSLLAITSECNSDPYNKCPKSKK